MAYLSANACTTEGPSRFTSPACSRACTNAVLVTSPLLSVSRWWHSLSASYQTLRTSAATDCTYALLPCVSLLKSVSACGRREDGALLAR